MSIIFWLLDQFRSNRIFFRTRASQFFNFSVTKNKLRKTKNAMQIYRSFYLNFYTGNLCIQRILFGFQSIVTMGVAGCNCFLVRLGRDLNPKITFILITFSLIGTLLWLILLQATGLAHKKTSSWIYTWKSQCVRRRERCYRKRVGNCLRPVTVVFSGFYK